MKLSLAATILAGVVSAARGDAVCGSDHSIALHEHNSLKFEGFNVESIERFPTDGEPKVVFKDFEAAPVVSEGEDGVISISTGAVCGTDGAQSGAMSMLSACSLFMGYPMVAGATLLASNILPVMGADGHDHGECAGHHISIEIYTNPIRKPPAGKNVCEGAKVTEGFENFPCEDIYTAMGLVNDEIEMKDQPQAGANVTKGYKGDLVTTALPITVPYYQTDLCPVNVHWHLGAEHLSVGEFDEDGSGPSSVQHRRKLAGETRLGGQCHYYDSEDPKFTTPYEWKYCDKSMEVGQTYEVHWPHSAWGACGTPNQYQYPFYDGVFCHIGTRYNAEKTISQQAGVQAQIFTIVNDESYYYPNMIGGMIVDGEMGQDIAAYTGSTTGTSRSNEICSAYTPVTWQVDRKCHLISASSFDKMCADMLSQRDDMSDDLYAHGSREVVADEYASNYQAEFQAPP